MLRNTHEKEARMVTVGLLVRLGHKPGARTSWRSSSRVLCRS